MMSKPQSNRIGGQIDYHVGARIRERRIMLGLTQQQFGKIIGVTYQQAHKYEHGINRISAGLLYEIARALDTPITYFYEGVGDEKLPQLAPRQRMLLQTVRNFAAIQNGQHQATLSEVARLLAGR
jgi:transcriptional regulator with XRE-family HTH domain